jgi:hypothetical protein
MKKRVDLMHFMVPWKSKLVLYMVMEINKNKVKNRCKLSLSIVKRSKNCHQLIKSWTHEKSHLDTNWVLPRSGYLCHTTGVAYHRHGDSTTHHWPWQAKTTFKNSAIFVSFSLLLINYFKMHGIKVL